MWLRLWREVLLELRVVDACAHFGLPEIIGLLVGFLFEHHIAICCQPKVEVAFRPQLLVGLFPLLRRIIKRSPGQKVEIETAEG